MLLKAWCLPEAYSKLPPSSRGEGQGCYIVVIGLDSNEQDNPPSNLERWKIRDVMRLSFACTANINLIQTAVCLAVESCCITCLLPLRRCCPAHVLFERLTCFANWNLQRKIRSTP
eukprot:scaffold190_cov112-Skeletonema_marinoi.AAC.7